MAGEKPIMNLNARMGFFFSCWLFLTRRYWAGGLEGRAVPSLQSCPAGSQAISLLPCSPATSSVEHRIVEQGVTGNEREKHSRLSRSKTVFLTQSSCIGDALCRFLELKSQFLDI